jgi:hypothetical protein
MIPDLQNSSMGVGLKQKQWLMVFKFSRLLLGPGMRSQGGPFPKRFFWTQP